MLLIIHTGPGSVLLRLILIIALWSVGWLTAARLRRRRFSASTVDLPQGVQ